MNAKDKKDEKSEELWRDTSVCIGNAQKILKDEEIQCILKAWLEGTEILKVGGEAYVTLSCLKINYPLMISINQNVIYISNIKCQINE